MSELPLGPYLDEAHVFEKSSERKVTETLAYAEPARGFSSYLPERISETAARQIGIWLVAVSLLLAFLVLVGGATRLTDSGLSIVEWKPVTGIVPPLSQEQWAAEFEKYKNIPEYEEINYGMSLDEFKTIFWWEWGHRFIARMLGFAFFIPFVFFLIKRRVPKELFPKLLTMFVLGGAQGALGWFMVMSGLSERVDVSQYRLVAHLGLAFFIFAYMLWVAFDLLLPKAEKTAEDVKPLITASYWLCGLVYVQVLLGGFVAGLRAGLIYNDWPWMDGRFVPDGYFFMSPWYLNFFENLASVQFNHRMVAYALTLAAVWMFYALRNVRLSPHAEQARWILLLSVLLQVGLGIWTLMAVVPIWLGVLHQGGALVTFTASLYLTQSLRKQNAGSPVTAAA